jgi:hypothetical protein
LGVSPQSGYAFFISFQELIAQLQAETIASADSF